jgi:hypothetical protein
VRGRRYARLPSPPTGPCCGAALPWQQAAPEDALRERITEFLLKHFKDPRICPENWRKVPDEATSVLRRWLTRIALEQFFEVVDQVAEAGQWMYRRPFWMSYDKANVIEDAWVLFGPVAKRLARISHRGGCIGPGNLR